MENVKSPDQHGKVSFNAKFARKVGKDAFIKAHEHHKDDVDLSKTYDELTAEQEEKPKEAAKAKPKR